MDDRILDFDYPTDSPKIIKVIGVGGGGGNAVTHMYKEGICEVSFVLCNTDSQALKRSDVPHKLILGRDITQGLGAGNKPEKAMAAAEESLDELRNMLSDGTKMVFITAGMGGGTGTGAAPVIARVAKDMGILTVGIVTIPFFFEGERKILQALDGVERMNQNVDALLVINNERLREIYSDLSVMNAFARADDTLAVAAKSIAEIITLPGLINLDFADVSTTMKDGGVALMSNGFASGENRVRNAITDAFNSPLLNNNNVFNAKKILFNISFSPDAELLMDEMTDIDNFMARFKRDIDVIWGTAVDETLGDKIKITILATGFDMKNSIPQIDDIRIMDEKIKKEREEEREKENRERISEYYGDRQGPLRKFAEVEVLSPDEMDDEAFISAIENNPTYKRDPKIIPALRSKSVNTSADDNHASDAITIDKEEPESEGTEGKTIISF